MPESKLTPDDEFRRIGWRGWQHVAQVAEDVYGLGDLMSRPILLQMITDSVLDEAIRPDMSEQRLGRGKLYQIYTDIKLEVEATKGRTLLTPEQRRGFAEALAMAMLMSQEHEIVLSGILAIVGSPDSHIPRLRSVLDNADAEQVAADVRLCTFLQHSEDSGGFSFVHRSFYEFFAASHLHRCAARNVCHRSMAASLPAEVVNFLSSLAEAEPAVLARYCRWLTETAIPAAAKDNALAILLRCNRQHASLVCDGGTLEGLQQPRIDLRNPRMANVRFKSLRADCLFVEGGKLSNIVVENSTLGGMEIDGCTAALEVVNSSFGPVVVRRGSLHADGRAVAVRRLAVEDGGSVVLTLGSGKVGELAVTAGSRARITGAVIGLVDAVGADVSLGAAKIDGLRANGGCLGIEDVDMRTFALAETALGPLDGGASRGPSLLANGEVAGGSCRFGKDDLAVDVRFEARADVEAERATFVRCKFLDAFVCASGHASSKRNRVWQPSANDDGPESGTFVQCRFERSTLELRDALLSVVECVDSTVTANGAVSRALRSSFAKCRLRGAGTAGFRIDQRDECTLVDCEVAGLFARSLTTLSTFRGVGGFLFCEFARDATSQLAPEVLDEPVWRSPSLLVLPSRWLRQPAKHAQIAAAVARVACAPTSWLREQIGPLGQVAALRRFLEI